MKEYFRLRTIPQITALDILREQGGRRRRIEPKNDSLSGSVQKPESFNVQNHIFRKPAEVKPNKSLIIAEAERITWEIEAHADYDTRGRLGVILQFSGIMFPNAPVFEKSKVYYGQDSEIFFSRIGYKNRRAFLILATRGNILEFQIVPNKINIRPFFREEIRLPQLTVTHNPTSMTVNEKNHLIIVSYNRL